MPSTSRARTGDPPFTRARFALPGVISTSTVVARPERSTRAPTTARSAPARTSAASVGTRWLDRVAR